VIMTETTTRAQMRGVAEKHLRMLDAFCAQTPGMEVEHHIARERATALRWLLDAEARQHEAIGQMLNALTIPENDDGDCATHAEAVDLCGPCHRDRQRRITVAADALRAALAKGQT
jgi:hypothetical protein